MRQLKFHEAKLLRKVDFLAWKSEGTLRELALLRRYHIGEREDYARYNRLAGYITSLVAKLRLLPPDNAYRVSATRRLLDKLFGLGLIDAATSLAKAEHLPAAAFARRRLPVVLVRLRMSETLAEATNLVTTGQVRVGPETVTDPAFLVTRAMEDHVRWAVGGKIRRAVAAYNDQADDYDLLGL